MREQTMPPESWPFRSAVIRVVLPYTLFASLWIILSDRIMLYLVHDVKLYGQLQELKGLGFVATSAGLLFLLLASEHRRRRAIEQDRNNILAREQAARARAESASRAKDEMLAMVSHELRTPLTPILTAAELLFSDPIFQGENRELLGRIRDNVLRESRIINDLLETTSLASGSLELVLDELDVHDVITRIADEFDHALWDKHLQLHRRFEARATRVRGDRFRLEQVLRNVLSNAIKFSPSGGSISVRTSLSPTHEDRLQIDVDDSGEGIPAEALTRLFQPFEQADRSINRKYGGLGLGLYLARAIVHLHGGQITAHSRGRGQGSTFTIHLPLCQSPMPSQATEPILDHPHVLLVEDNPDTLKLMIRILRRLGCEVESAASADEALAIALQNPPDLIISDIGLPDRSGWELMRTLRSKYALPGIAISGFGSDDDRKQSHLAGFSAHLVKPVSVQALRLAMDQALRTASAA